MKRLLIAVCSSGVSGVDLAGARMPASTDGRLRKMPISRTSCAPIPRWPGLSRCAPSSLRSEPTYPEGVDKKAGADMLGISHVGRRRDDFEHGMKQEDDYVDGPHHYWIHYWCGLIFGAFIGIWTGREVFDGGWALGVATTVIALVVAWSCGRWGDRAWRWIIDLLWSR